jgi:peroxiredoxin
MIWVMAARRQRQLLDPGSPAPGFRLSRLEGGEATLAHFAARAPVLLVFFKVTCPVCQLAMPFLERIHAAGTLAIRGISQNHAADTREFNGYFGVTFPTLLDSEDEDFPASNAYGISSVPTMFLVEPDGLISRVIEGWNKLDMEALGAAAGITLFRPGDNVPAWKAG